MTKNNEALNPRLATKAVLLEEARSVCLLCPAAAGRSLFHCPGHADLCAERVQPVLARPHFCARRLSVLGMLSSSVHAHAPTSSQGHAAAHHRREADKEHGRLGGVHHAHRGR